MRSKVVRTTISDNQAPCPLDRVNRQFRAARPNQLWVSDFTYVSTWQGWLYVAFVIDVFARRIVGWRVSSSMRTDFVLDAQEQALWARQPERDSRLIHHSDRGGQGPFLRPKLKQTITGNSPIKPSQWQRNLNPAASTNPGAIHVSFGVSVVKLFFDSVVIAAIPTIVPRRSLTKANSWYEAANSTAYTLGPALAGWILQTLSATAVYAVNSVLYLASTLLIKKTVFPRLSHEGMPSQSHLADIADGIRLLWRNEIQRTVAMAADLFNLFHTGFLTVFTLYALKELNFSAASFGTILSIVGVFGLLGAICAPRLIDALGVRTALVGSLLVIGPIGVPILFSVHLPFIHRAALIAGCLAAWDFFIVVHVIIEQTIRQMAVRNDQLSRITATIRFVSWGADPIGAILGGLAASSTLGSRGTLSVCLIGFVVSGAVLLMSKGVRNLNADDLRSPAGPVTGDS